MRDVAAIPSSSGWPWCALLSILMWNDTWPGFSGCRNWAHAVTNVWLRLCDFTQRVRSGEKRAKMVWYTSIPIGGLSPATQLQLQLLKPYNRSSSNQLICWQNHCWLQLWPIAGFGYSRLVAVTTATLCMVVQLAEGTRRIPYWGCTVGAILVLGWS